MGFIVVVVIAVFQVRASIVRIPTPKLGVLNLKGSSVNSMVEEDMEAVGAIFTSTEESPSRPPSCDVLLLYCDIGPDGRVDSSTAGLRDMIRDSGALVVIVASENPIESCEAATQPAGYGKTNLVVTVGRHGEVFAAFLNRLFTAMAQGTVLQRVLKKAAAQNPKLDAPGMPDCIWNMEAGPVTFTGLK